MALEQQQPRITTTLPLVDRRASLLQLFIPKPSPAPKFRTVRTDTQAYFARRTRLKSWDYTAPGEWPHMD